MKFEVLLALGLGLLQAVHRCEAYQWKAATLNDAYIATKNGSGSNVWQKDLMDYYKGCSDVLEFFPEETYEIGRTLLTSFTTHVDYLGSLTTYNSTIISEGSKSSLEAMSLLSKLGKSREHLLFEWRLAAPRISSAYRNIIWKLSPFIGELVGPINEVISELETSIIQVLFEFENRFEERKQERCAKIAVEETVKNLQILLNRIALIAETALNDCDCFKRSDDVFDALKIAALITNHYLIAVQGTGSNIASELISESENFPPSHDSCYHAMDPLLKSVAHSISAITRDDNQSTREWLATFVGETKKFNQAVEEALGPLNDHGITVSQVKRNLAKLQGNGFSPFCKDLLLGTMKP